MEVKMPAAEMVDIALLKPYKKNTKRHTQTQIDNVAESIRKFGFVQPFVIDKNNEVVIGHCRLFAAQKLGIKELPCVRVDYLTSAQVKALRILDNKLNESEWDLDFLNEELPEIDLTGFDTSDFGWGANLIDSQIEEDDVPEITSEEPTVKRGEIWQLGEHRLICGDATNEYDVKRLMNGEMADLLLTDPPYNVGYVGKTEKSLTIQNDELPAEEFGKFLASAFSNANRVLRAGAAFYVWFASKNHCAFERGLEENGLEVKEELVWVKNSLCLGRSDYQWRHEPCMYGWKGGAAHNWYADRSQTTVLEFNKPNKNEEHPTMKPVELFAYQINNSTKRGDIVLDLFGGSGTSIVACEQLGRKCYTVEYDEKYCDVIIERWEKFTGKKATRAEK